MMAGRKAKRRWTASRRKAVAWWATGSSTQGMPAWRAASAVSSMLSSQGADSVPILMTTAPAICANSGASSVACTMAGDAPIASSTLAAKFM
ncbi:hypothetical protein G6F62_015797 [Rhizopus arrhizus]|nr:hypothetical protein G6F62_015797 [Rhizopus arrhizus]